MPREDEQQDVYLPNDEGWITPPRTEEERPDAVDRAVRSTLRQLDAVVHGDQFSASLIRRMREETAEAMRLSYRLTQPQRRFANEILRSRSEYGTALEVLRDVSQW